MSDLDGRWVDVGDASSLHSGELRQVEVDGVLIVLVETNDAVVAFQGLCSHEAYPMADGFVDRGSLVCALHGSTFDLETGDATLGPADKPLAQYPVDIVDGRIRIFTPTGGLQVNE